MKHLIALLVLVSASRCLAGGEGKGTDGKDTGVDVARLWAQTCTRCHNARPAKSYSDAQWDVIVHHMRIRANLTGEEARLITQFLKEAN